MIFFAAGDPGGSRAIMQVILQMEKEGLPYVVLEHGYLGNELPIEARGHLCPPDKAKELVCQASAFVFGSSVSDVVPLDLARHAKKRGLPVMHILDNWSSYLKRLCTDGQPPLIPDVYAVPDAIARDMAQAEGVPGDCIAVTGHPCMGRGLPGEDAREMGAVINVAFISEPFSMVLGHDITAPNHPGFTEDAVLSAFCESMRQFGERACIHILPHPKQDLTAIRELWAACGNGLKGVIHRPGLGSRALSGMDGVAGMASILLYEAWLKGLPCLCMQPGCRTADLRRFSLLDGIFYAGEWSAMQDATARWFELCAAREAFATRPEAEIHKGSVKELISILKTIGQR